IDWLRSRGLTPERELEEAVMEFNVSLITRPLEGWSATSRNLFIYFSGILSFDLRGGPKSRGGFIPADQSTSILSSFI
ncbi:hypothetical protein OR221_2994, partial [Microbacterium laevaniformans OR221]